MKPIIIIVHDEEGRILSAAVPAKKLAGQVHLVPNEHEHVIEVHAAKVPYSKDLEVLGDTKRAGKAAQTLRKITENFQVGPGGKLLPKRK
jgi:hypothetical protein